MAETGAVDLSKDDYTKRELDAIAAAYFVHRRGALGELAALPSKAKAYLVQTAEFSQFIRALQFDAACGNERITRSQLRAIDWFRKEAEASAKQSKRSRVGVSFNVQPQDDEKREPVTCD